MALIGTMQINSIDSTMAFITRDNTTTSYIKLFGFQTSNLKFCFFPFVSSFAWDKFTASCMFQI